MDHLERITQIADRIERLEGDLDDQRRQLETAIVEANDDGASYQQIADLLGLSKARIGEMAAAARKGVTPYALRKARA